MQNGLAIAGPRPGRRSLRTEIVAGEMYVWVVDENGNDVGQAICSFRFSPEVPGDLVELVPYGQGTEGYAALSTLGTLHISGITTLAV